LHLLHDRKLIAERVQNKRTLLLDWLKGEGFSTTQILCQVLSLKDRATRLTLDRMAQEGLIEQHEVSGLGGSIRIWGITPHGAAVAVDPNNPDFSYFEPGRLSPSTIQHALAVQQVRLEFSRRGWTQWQTDRQCHQLEASNGWLKIPDAVAMDPQGKLVAIEVERTFKTLKRYQAILANYLRMAAQQKIDRVEYVCPLPGMASKLELMFCSIKTVPVQGQVVAIKPEHLDRFTFTDFSTRMEARHG
jgi:hypothetical protein